MSTAKNKNVIIALDPGFDSLKVTTDGREMFKFNKEVAEITGKDFVGMKDDSYIEVNYLPGKTHLVGACAARILNETSGSDNGTGIEERANIADTFATFETKDKEILIMTGVALALIKQAESGEGAISFNDLDDENGMKVREVVTSSVNLYVGVALPHDAVEKEWGYINSWLKGHHEYSVINGGIKYVINIDINKTFPNSQVVLALIGAISDDKGRINMSKNCLTTNDLPAIVIDGGYLTLGKTRFTTAQSVEDSESNTEYAMKNIYEKVAEIIRTNYNRPEFNSRRVRHAAEINRPIHYINEKGEGESIDITELIKEQVRNVCSKMIDEFNVKYNNLQDIETILVTGGTGYIYYEEIKKLLKNRSWIKVILTDYDFMGEKISPEYAISVGLYKALYHQAERENA